MSTSLNDIASVKVKTVLEYVGDDPTLAASALEKEQARGTAARSTLVEQLRRIVDGRALDEHRTLADGGTDALVIPEGVTVSAVIDGSTGRRLPAGEYDQTTDGELTRTDGGQWPAGRGRWFVDHQG
jgi:hypothetical protein